MRRLRPQERISLRPSGEVTILDAARQTVSTRFRLTAPADRTLPPRTVLTANVILDGADFGELPETLIERRRPWMYWVCNTGCTSC